MQRILLIGLLVAHAGPIKGRIPDKLTKAPNGVTAFSTQVEAGTTTWIVQTVHVGDRTLRFDGVKIVME